MIRNLKYDKDTYLGITETDKFSKVPDLEMVDESELETIASKQVGEELTFTSDYKFDTTDLGRILGIHTPTETNAYFYKCVNNVLVINFYRV